MIFHQESSSRTAATTTVTITKRPALTMAAPAVVVTAAAIAVALLGLHIQFLCLQFLYVILNQLKVSTIFELAYLECSLPGMIVLT